MKLQFLNSIPLHVISGGNIYNKTIIDDLREKDIAVDYNNTPSNKDYDITIVDSLFMKDGPIEGLKHNKPLIALIHQIPELDNTSINFYRSNAKFIVTGEPAKQELICNWRLSYQNIKVIRPGIPATWKPKTTFNNSPKRILLVANFVQHKGFEMLIRLLEHRCLNGLEFHIIGNNTLDSTYSETIIKSIRKTKANTEFHFNSSRDEVYHLLLKSDIFLSLSKSETFGMATFEALALGLPCLAYKTGDFDYFSQYSNYIIIEDYSENAFIESIEELVNNSKIYNLYRNTTSKNRREWHEVSTEFLMFLKTML